MKKSIFITAVSGTGKSTVCKELQKLGYTAYDIEVIPGLFTLYEKRTNNVLNDPTMDSLELAKISDWRCDKTKLAKLISNEKSDLAFYVGAAYNRKEIIDLFDSVILLRVSDETSRKRLGTRKTGEFGNTEEIRDWILSWKQKTEEVLLSLGAIEISAEESPEVVARNIIKSVFES